MCKTCVNVVQIMCVCVYVCERLIERESERKRDGCWYDCGSRDEGIPWMEMGVGMIVGHGMRGSHGYV